MPGVKPGHDDVEKSEPPQRPVQRPDRNIRVFFLEHDWRADLQDVAEAVPSLPISTPSSRMKLSNGLV